MGSISVVIPCFNLGEFLPEALASARRQSRPADQIIIVDDGSTDPRTIQVVEKLRGEGAQVWRIPNQGVSAARNFGVGKARGEFILCLDADDVLLPDYLRETAAVLETQPQTGIVATHVEFFGAGSGIWDPPPFDPVRMLWHNCIPSASLYRRTCWEQVGGYRHIQFEDWNLWISIVEQGWTWSVVPKPLYRYRKRAGSRSETFEENRAELFRELIELHPEYYRRHFRAVLVDMDLEYRRLRLRHKQSTQENRTQAETIENLRKALQAKETLMTYELPKNVPNDQELHAKIAALTKQVEALKIDIDRRQQTERICRMVRGCLPAQARVLVVSKGDGDLLELEGRQGLHFPQTSDGAYTGFHPGNSDEAIAHLESLRGQGAEYLLLPSTSFWWLDHYRRFAEHLEQRYDLVARQNDAGLIYRLTPRTKPVLHTFSVVICTYKRAAYLGKAIESLFQQDYPKDKYEIIIINNDSPDNTEEIARHYAQQSPVPYAYHVEKRNGLSYARNLGVAKARLEYVAYLDDDATACTNWLSTFNTVINDHKALVVGGRVEVVHEEGYVPPDWFNYQYVKGFFGINYRDWGKKESVFRIRQPLYLGGGNSAYARHLFRYFGGYSPKLGRDGKTLLAGEETYLNLLMDKEDIPIYYADDAVIYHFIEASRITKEHIKSKAHWGGITNAIIHSMFFGFRETRKKARGNVKELKALVQAVRANRGDPQNFSRIARIVYHLAYLRKFRDLQLKRLTGVQKYVPQEVAWQPDDWVEELSRLPKRAENLQRLYDLYVALKREDRARAVHAKLMKRLAQESKPAKDTGDPSQNGVHAPEPYHELVRRVQQTVAAHLPPGAKIIVVSKGDNDLVNLADRHGWHFPQANGGSYAGSYPKNSTEAIGQLESLRGRGGEYLLLPKTALWWLDHYPGFKEHLEKTCHLAVRQEDTCVIFALNGTNGDCNGTGNQAIPGATAKLS